MRAPPESLRPITGAPVFIVPTFETDDGWRKAAGYVALSAKERGDAYQCDLGEAPAP